MEYLIREMTADDWLSVSEIYQQGILTGKSTFKRECPNYEAWDSSHLTDCRFVITVGAKVVGWCALSSTSASEAYCGVAELSIYLDAAYRKQGLGTKLLQYLCTASEKSGYWCLYSAILSINQESLALHKKCGFRVIGQREKIAKDRFGNWQDTTVCERRNNIL